MIVSWLWLHFLGSALHADAFQQVRVSLIVTQVVVGEVGLNIANNRIPPLDGTIKPLERPVFLVAPRANRCSSAWQTSRRVGIVS